MQSDSLVRALHVLADAVAVLQELQQEGIILPWRFKRAEEELRCIRQLAEEELSNGCPTLPGEGAGPRLEMFDLEPPLTE